MEFLWILSRKPLEIDSSPFKTRKAQMLKVLNDKFDTGNPDYAYYADTENYLKAPIQGEKYCEYEK